jgi:hypothetical protein
MRAFLLQDTKTGMLYIAFGEDCVEAARGLERKGVNFDDISVSGGIAGHDKEPWVVSPDNPISLSDKIWMYFTNNPRI